MSNIIKDIRESLAMLLEHHLERGAFGGDIYETEQLIIRLRGAGVAELADAPSRGNTVGSSPTSGTTAMIAVRLLRDGSRLIDHPCAELYVAMRDSMLRIADELEAAEQQHNGSI